MQDNVGTCPITGWTLIVFQGNFSGSWGVARNVNNGSQRYEYLNQDLTWHPSNSRGLSKEEAYALAKEWLNYCERNSDRLVLQGAIVDQAAAPPVVVIPLLLDKTRMRVQFKCPQCGMDHKSQIKSEKWGEIVETIKRKCPKEGDDGVEFHIRLWKGDRDHPVCALGDIDPLPTYNCKECWGTGEYVGFVAKEPCSTCFPKPKDPDALKNYKSTSFP